ncbi:unnamed protein product [Rhizophagus irregularis]|uniref:GATA-type domain-containing protein n=1 Tax=Rhizophagus irregularis TaxID=588596 RepID=A0A2I1GU78_9GLOM|nr:hypothetical protein RhiirC2_488554 [Rhizophagus irregularis]PKY50115.1 hypothetical protein RhiirA4_529422 [Rhizophagus irregularis]CAB4382734.1 unnamed protein product [Rhizophagus irregularis]CAB4419116.1 unnamed protein product [Rhizophagus irregularis]CAB5371859.1 unnamed protein product [Rhizophagus irregularis]
MDVASICLPLVDKTISTSASLPKTNVTSSTESLKSTLPPISSLLSQHPDKTSPTHHENHTAQPYLHTKPNSVQLTQLESQKSSANSSPSLINLHPLSLETPRQQSSTQIHPSPPLTTPNLSRSNSNILLNEQNRSPESKHSSESVASLSKSSPLLNPHEINVSQQKQHSSFPKNSFSHSNTLTQPYQQSQWQRQHSQMLPSNQQDAIPPKDTKRDSVIQQQQQTMQYDAAIAAGGLPSEYHYYRASFEKDVYQSVTRGTERTMADLRKIIDHCAIIGQFATQYGEICSRTGNSRPDIWPMQPAIPIPTEAHVSEMINKAFDILYVLNALKDEASRRGPSEIELIRNKRSTTAASSRPKYRKRTKRPAPPGRCHSCNIQETPEWRRGPDGARTLCNACGLHFAKLTRKRAQNAIQEQQQRLAQHRTYLHHPYPPPYLQIANQNQNALNITQYPGFPQHNVSQSGNQFINTPPPSISRVSQGGYSSTTRIEID